MTWYDSNWKDRYPVAVNVLGGAESPGTHDIEVIIPSDWERLWSNIRADGFDLILVSNQGQLLTFKRNAFSFANKTATLQAQAVSFQNRNSMSLVYVYFNNPDQSVDLASVFSASTPKNGSISLNAPSRNAVSSLNQAIGSDGPVATFQKTTNENYFIYFRVGSLMAKRITAYNKSLGLEDIDYIKINSLDAAGANDVNRYTEGETRFLPQWVGVKVKAGSNSTNYTVVCNVTTTGNNLTEEYSARCLLKVRDLLP